MPAPFSAQHFPDIRDDVQRMVERAREHEADMEALEAAATIDVRHAEAALSRTRDVPEDQLRAVLEPYLQRHVAAVDAAKHLSVRAREQHQAARELLIRLNGNGAAAALPAGASTRCHAVLVVDDHDDMRELVAVALQTAGFIVRTATNGLEALIAAYEMRPSVIVMDVSMPVLDGVQATRLIKATPATRSAKVIAYTGKVTFDWQAEPLFTAVLEKPASVEKMLAAVRHVADL